MIREEPANGRALKTIRLEGDLVVVGGGLAGTCGAITAARAGLKVVLIQDRPVLGGNASSEVRLWILGATSHQGNNNRWAREGGVVDEILVENLYRNPEGNPLMVDALLLEKAVSEPNLTLLLNTAVHDLRKSDPDTIESVRAFCPQNSTAYEVAAPLFCDASGDGIVGFLSGAAFRVGAEARSEFGESLAPVEANRELLGHSLYFYARDTGRPVRFVPPSFALQDLTAIPRYRDFNVREHGCRLWWIEWGGHLDTVHDTERIKWELWKVAYGVWNHLKNSGRFPEAETLTLEWVGTIPGKRESRRFEGDYLLTQQDIVEQRPHHDAVSFGGWAIDLHPPEGVFSARPGCEQWHSKGVYPIPYRCFYSRNITNLFLAGRLISASHLAFGSTRVMATCAHGAQAVALAAALCRERDLRPRDLGQPPHLATLQQRLLRAGQFIPWMARDDAEDLARHATLTASSELRLAGLVPNDETRPLDRAWAMLLPVPAGPMPRVTVLVDVTAATELAAELRLSSKPCHHTPDLTARALRVALKPGRRQPVTLDFATVIGEPRYGFVCLMENPHVAVHLSDQRVTGVLAVSQKFNRAVAKAPRQDPPPDSGLESFEFWLPERRPGGKNLAVTLEPALDVFGVNNLTNGWARPIRQPNAWVAAFEDEQPCLRLTWPRPQTIARVELVFDTDFDHPMESVLLGHPERVMPFCVPHVAVWNGRARRDEKPSPPVAVAAQSDRAAHPVDGFRHAARDDDGRRGGRADAAGSGPPGLLARVVDNHETRRVLRFARPVETDCLVIHLTAPSGTVPAALFEVRCYA